MDRFLGVNSNNAGLIESSFSEGEGQIDPHPSFIFQEKLI